MNAQNTIAALLAEHSPQTVLEALSENLKNKEKILQERYDSHLGNSFDMLVTLLVEVYPKLGKRDAAMAKMTLLSKPVVESMKIRKADSPLQSLAMREAKAFIEKLSQLTFSRKHPDIHFTNRNPTPP